MTAQVFRNIEMINERLFDVTQHLRETNSYHGRPCDQKKTMSSPEKIMFWSQWFNTITTLISQWGLVDMLASYIKHKHTPHATIKINGAYDSSTSKTKMECQSEIPPIDDDECESECESESECECECEFACKRKSKSKSKSKHEDDIPFKVMMTDKPVSKNKPLTPPMTPTPVPNDIEESGNG